MNKRSHPLKGRKLPPEVLEKRRATRLANKAAGGNPADRVKDSVVYLRHAIQKWPSEARTKVNRMHRLLVELALATLEGK